VPAPRGRSRASTGRSPPPEGRIPHQFRVVRVGGHRLLANGQRRFHLPAEIERQRHSADRFLPYLTGGLAWANVDHKLECDRARVSQAIVGCATNFETKSDTTWGCTVGAGVEYVITNNITAKAEYLYTDLGNNDVTLVDVNYPLSDVNNRKFDTSFNSVKLGLNYKF